MFTSTTATAPSFTWNGPTCGTCGARHLDRHTCTAEDIMRRVNELPGHLPKEPASCNPTQTCPCRPENGGSGVCGCTLGGPRITC